MQPLFDKHNAVLDDSATVLTQLAAVVKRGEAIFPVVSVLIIRATETCTRIASLFVENANFVPLKLVALCKA